MQAVLLGAGQSSRFFPLNIKHKCLTKIAGESIAVHTVRAVKRTGISDIIFVVPNENDFQQTLGNGKKYGVKIRYVIQKEAKGMGDGLLCAEKFIDSDFFLINSNHVDFEILKKAIDEKRNNNREAVLVADEKDGGHFGALKISGDRVLSVVEKPESKKGLSKLRVIGVYFLNKEFINILKKEKVSQYNFESALDKFAKSGKVKVAKTPTKVLSLKYPWDLLDIKDYILGRLGRKISKQAKISDDAIIDGNVVIESGAVISERATIKGPAYIGKNVFIGSSTLVRNSSDIEDNATIGAYMEIRGSLISDSVKTHSGFIGDSVIGQGTKIGAIFGSANVRLDRADIKAVVKGEKIDAGRRALGAIIGSNSTIGERVSTMPGVIIGNNVNIGPSTTVMKNVDSDTAYYTKFAEIIEKKRVSS